MERMAMASELRGAYTGSVPHAPRRSHHGTLAVSSAAMQPQPNQPAASHAQETNATTGPSLSDRAWNAFARAVAFAVGAGLLIGFFLPWLKLGEAAAFSGFALLASSGQVIDALAGPSRGLLLLIPLAGTAIIASSIAGPRAATTASLISGLLILCFGFYTALRVFLGSTGLGMWLVVLCALLATGLGLASSGRRSR
jgi:hypothetical protein